MKEERKLQLKLLQKTHNEQQAQKAAWFWEPACGFCFFAYNQITLDNRKSAQAQIIPVCCDLDGKTVIKQKYQSDGFTWSEICSVNRIKFHSLMLKLFAKTSSWRLHTNKSKSSCSFPFFRVSLLDQHLILNSYKLHFCILGTTMQ